MRALIREHETRAIKYESGEKFEGEETVFGDDDLKMSFLYAWKELAICLNHGFMHKKTLETLWVGMRVSNSPTREGFLTPKQI